MGKSVLHTVQEFAPTTKINVLKPQLSSSCVSQGCAPAATRASNIPLMAEPRENPTLLLSEIYLVGDEEGSREVILDPDSASFPLRASLR